MGCRLFSVIVLAGVVGLMLGSAARAEQKPAESPKESPLRTFTGEITSIEKIAGQVTIRKFPVSKTFLVARDCKFTTTDKPNATLKDFKVGDNVKVKYEEAKDGLVARLIIIRGIDAEDRKDAREEEQLAPKQ